MFKQFFGSDVKQVQPVFEPEEDSDMAGLGINVLEQQAGEKQLVEIVEVASGIVSKTLAPDTGDTKITRPVRCIFGHFPSDGEHVRIRGMGGWETRGGRHNLFTTRFSSTHVVQISQFDPAVFQQEMRIFEISNAQGA